MATRKPIATGANYRLSSLVTDKDFTSYEYGISRIISKVSDPGAQAGGVAKGSVGAYLPSGLFLRDLGINNAGAVVATGLEAVAAASRPKLLLEELGAQRVEVTGTGPVDLPVWIGGTGGWIADDANAPALATTVRSCTATARNATARITVSRRLQNSAAELEVALLAEVKAAVTDVLESGFINGNGSNSKPLGLLNTPGASAKAFAGAVPTNSELIDMVELIGDADADLSQAAWLLNPSDLAALLKASLVAFIDGKHRIAGFPAYTSRHVTEGKFIFLDPTIVRTIYWDAPQLLIDRYSNGKSISGAVELVLMNLADIAVIHPARIAVGSA